MWKYKQEKKIPTKEDISLKSMLISCKKDRRKGRSPPSDHIHPSPVPGTEYLLLNVAPYHPSFNNNFLLKIAENNNAQTHKGSITKVMERSFST